MHTLLYFKDNRKSYDRAKRFFLSSSLDLEMKMNKTCSSFNVREGRAADPDLDPDLYGIRIFGVPGSGSESAF